MSDRPLAARTIAAAVHRLLRRRGAGKTLCPSEVARALADPATDDWRAAMPRVRAVVTRLAARGEIVVRQRGRTVDPERARGPIRIAAAPGTAGVGRTGNSR